jgi:hypothetical protein
VGQRNSTKNKGDRTMSDTLTEDDWKVVEARLQYDIDHNIGMDMMFGVLGEEHGN